MTTTNPPKHFDGLIRYLSHPNERANEDFAISYFRNLFPKFTRQSEASRSDGYVAGHFVLELKSKASDWYSGLIQGLAYKTRELDFSIVVVAAEGFLAIWRVDDIPDEIQEAILKKNGAPNKIGKELAASFKQLKDNILKKAIWHEEQLHHRFLQKKDVVILKLQSFEETIKTCQKVRQRITTKNFTTILKQMVYFFDQKKPIKCVGAFYAMIFGWNEGSILKLSNRDSTTASLNGEQIKNLVPDKRIKFKSFVENYYVYLDENENIDDFFAQYDIALDTVDKNFRIQNGIFFTDLDLSKFAMWLVKQNIPELGKNYIVIDPACGSGNLVTNWRSPLKLRHKVVSEIEPELLFAVEKRMKGDTWHNGKFTVVPKIEESKGLNFLDKSAEKYIDIINQALIEKGLTFNKPIAFLCNPPYRGDDDRTAEKPNYEVHPSIIEVISEEAKAERYCCFLAQMKLICDHAAKSNLPDDSVLLLFTKSGWLTNRLTFDSLRSAIFKSFDFIDGILVYGKEFFDLKGRFPIAFTIWKYKEKSDHSLTSNKQILLKDLTWITKKQLHNLPWDDEEELNKSCRSIFVNPKSILVSLDKKVTPIKDWISQKQKMFQRSRRKSERGDNRIGGLPAHDKRLDNKCAYGENDGLSIGFMDDLTPCRIKETPDNIPWFRLNAQFMDCNRTRCFSGRPDQKGYCATSHESAVKTFLWFSISRTFALMGYPLWADALHLWAPSTTKILQNTAIKYAFSIGLAENECVETMFPAGNPTKGAPQIYCTNPMSPINPDSFWSIFMVKEFLKPSNSIPDQLVKSVNLIYEEWKKRFKNNPEIIVTYKQPYFIGKGLLKVNSGLIQIKDFAKYTNDKTLLNLISNTQKLLKEAKKEFYNMLIDSKELNYFGSPKVAHLIDQVSLKKYAEHDIYNKRLILATLIVKTLSSSKSFGRTKFAKVFYIADMSCDQDLKTNYYREAAGPVDYNLLYDDKNNIESLAAKMDYFTTKQIGKTVKFIPGNNIVDINNHIESIFGKKYNELIKIIELFRNLNTEQSEIIATLFACWNDLLIEREEVTAKLIIYEARNHWHLSKKRFTEDRLRKALTWMKEKNIIPRGVKRHTITKPKK